MNLSKLTMTVLGILLTAMPITAFCGKGGSDGGGGGAIVRYNKNKTIKNSELLDLWEGRNLRKQWEMPSAYKLNIPYTNEPVQKQIERAMAKLRAIDPVFAERVNQDLKFVQDPANWEDDLDQRNIKIAAPADALDVYLEEGTDLLGMMYFNAELQQLSIKRSIFDRQINNTSIAASYMHEAIYKTMRDLELVYGDSTEVRNINACLFATDDCFGLRVAKLQPLSGAELYSCSSQTETDVPMTVVQYSASRDFDYFRAELQLTRFGTAKYQVPYLASFEFSRNTGKEKLPAINGSSYGISNRIFEIYIRRWQGYKTKLMFNKLASVLQLPDYNNVTGEMDKKGNVLHFTLPASPNAYTEDIIPAQTFQCLRLR